MSTLIFLTIFSPFQLMENNQCSGVDPACHHRGTFPSVAALHLAASLVPRLSGV